MKKTILMILSLLLLTTMCSKDDKESLSTIVKIMFTLNGPVFQGDGYPEGTNVPTDFAVWVEDESGEFVKTLQVTPTAVTVDTAHGSHIEHLAVWSEAAGVTYADLAAETDDGVAPSYDGLTTASPNLMAGPAEQSFTVSWDLTDANGDDVEPGQYICVIESANISKNTIAGSDEVEFSVLNGVNRLLINTDTEATSIQAQPTAVAFSAEFTESSASLSKTVIGLD